MVWMAACERLDFQQNFENFASHVGDVLRYGFLPDVDRFSAGAFWEGGGERIGWREERKVRERVSERSSR